MKINYAWSMPNYQTFKIKPVADFLKSECVPYNKIILDPFANRKHRFATFTNDLDSTKETHFNLDAKKFLNLYADNTIDIILFDPPYSLRQLKECYNSIGQSLTQHDTTLFFTEIKDLIAQKLAPGGICYSFGWSSVGLGKSRGFIKSELLLICHGGNHNDTIVLKEIKT